MIVVEGRFRVNLNKKNHSRKPKKFGNLPVLIIILRESRKYTNIFYSIKFHVNLNLYSVPYCYILSNLSLLIFNFSSKNYSLPLKFLHFNLIHFNLERMEVAFNLFVSLINSFILNINLNFPFSIVFLPVVVPVWQIIV